MVFFIAQLKKSNLCRIEVKQSMNGEVQEDFTCSCYSNDDIIKWCKIHMQVNNLGKNFKVYIDLY